MRAIARHSFVNRVIDGLVYEVVETLLADVSNIHGRTLAYGLQSLEYLNVTRGIILFLIQLFFCHCLLSSQFWLQNYKKS